jgi:hypothetical protein
MTPLRGSNKPREKSRLCNILISSMNFNLHPNTCPVLVSRLSWPGTGHVLWQIGICDLPEHFEWMAGVWWPSANGKESGAKIRVEKTKAISNSSIRIGKPLSGIALGLLSLLKTANRSSRPWLAGHLSFTKSLICIGYNHLIDVIASIKIRALKLFQMSKNC